MRDRRRRTQDLGGTYKMTLLGAVIPGAGYWYAGRRALGGLLLLLFFGSIGAVAWYFGRDLRTALDLAFDPVMLKAAALALMIGLALWAFMVYSTYRLVRPRRRARKHTVLGHAFVAFIVAIAAFPVFKAAEYAVVTADTIETVFKDDVKSATIPEVDEEDPWADHDRVNVLLLGGDGTPTREGIRTDTVILVSMDTKGGKTLMFSLPRNMMYAQFPEDTPLHDAYPYGFGYGSGEDPAYFMLNAVYGQVPTRNPGILGETDSEGADAVKLAVEGSLGLPVDYYLMVNIEGFKEVVDAIGGITVNVNEPVAINGNTDLGIPPTDYIDPGPSQQLDGFHALWFARGRYGSDDYERMDRQRCAVDALIEAADPQTMLSRYVELARAGREIVYTDIPRSLGPAFVELLLEVKDNKSRSIVFRPSENFSSSDPDFDYVRDLVQRAIDPPRQSGPKKRKNLPSEAEDPIDACSYQPDGVDPEADEELENDAAATEPDVSYAD